MGIAAKCHHCAVFLAAAQHFQSVSIGVFPEAARPEGGIVDLQERTRLPGCPGKDVIVRSVPSVVGVADNVDIVLPHGIDVGSCILLPAACLSIAGRMDTGHRYVKRPDRLLRQIHRAILIQYVQFHTEEQPEISQLPGNHLQVLEIVQAAGSGHLGRVLRDSKSLQPFTFSHGSHLPDRVVSMAAGNGVGVCGPVLQSS